MAKTQIPKGGISSDIELDGDISITGTTPSLTMGDAGAEDAKIVFDGNAQDYHIGLDDSADDLIVGLGSALGTTAYLKVKSDGDIHLPVDEKGLVFGAGDDCYFGSNEGEQGFIMNSGAAFGALGTLAGGGFQFLVQSTASNTEMQIFGGEGYSAGITFKADQGDDHADRWLIGNSETNATAALEFGWLSYSSGSWDKEMELNDNGVLASEGAMNASTTVDYAEYFEWKTELANDDKIIETYGMTVVLDNGKVRLAEAGEEAKVLGIVRPNNVSAVVGGSEEFKHKDKYEKNVWGETVMEEYTLVKWNETINKYWKDGDALPEGVKVGDVRGTHVYQHEYHKDRIPAKKLKSMVKDGIPETLIDRSEPNWHTLASNLSSEDLVVPSTNAEKTAANYVERTTYSKDKGEYKKGDKLMRKKVNSSYDSTKTYVPRRKRRKEWCIVGLIGQVEIRDSAVIPTSWTKMKNLESGIDLYYIK